MPSRHFGAEAEAGSRVMAMGIGVVAASTGKGTGAISRGALGGDGPAATARDETAASGAGLRGATRDGGFGPGFIAGAVAASSFCIQDPIAVSVPR